MADVKGMFQVDIIRNGEVIDSFTIPNVVTDEFKVYLLRSGLSGEITPTSNWYVGLIGSNYTPTASDTAATALGSSGYYSEVTAYSEATRPVYSGQYVSTPSKMVTNASNPANFTMSSTVTVYGVFIVSSSAKLSSSGVLAAASKFSSARQLLASDSLSIRYSINVSA